MSTRGWAAVAVAVVVGYQAYALWLKRSGETAYLPRAADTFPSAEIAGAVALQQTFVMHADGLERIHIHPLRSSGEPRGRVELTLRRDNWVQPFAVSSFPAERLLGGDGFDWHVPRVEASAGRTFTLIVALPEAPPGHGIRFALGVPRYAEGQLFVGDRGAWGDLTFATTAHRARLIDTVTALRREAPVLGSEAVLVIAWLVFNAALVILIVQAIASVASRPG